MERCRRAIDGAGLVRKIGLFFAVAWAAVAFASSASASFSDCRSIADPVKRLACYDKAANAPARSGTTAAVNPVEGAASNTIPATQAETSEMGG